jgi:hypothetical protein
VSRTRRWRYVQRTETWPGDPERGIPGQKVVVRQRLPVPPPRWMAGERRFELEIPADPIEGRYARRVSLTLRWNTAATRSSRRAGATDFALAGHRLRAARSSLPWVATRLAEIAENARWALLWAEDGWRHGRLRRRGDASAQGCAAPSSRGRVRRSLTEARAAVRWLERCLPPAFDDFVWLDELPAEEDDEALAELAAAAPPPPVDPGLAFEACLPPEVPGPPTPEEAGWCVALVARAAAVLARAVGCSPP